MPYAFGNKISWNETSRTYIVNATGETLTDTVLLNLVCPKCGKKPNPDGQDPCIPNLPGVDFACCGHGIKDGYVKFTNGIILRGGFDHLQSVDDLLRRL